MGIPGFASFLVKQRTRAREREAAAASAFASASALAAPCPTDPQSHSPTLEDPCAAHSVVDQAAHTDGTAPPATTLDALVCVSPQPWSHVDLGDIARRFKHHSVETAEAHHSCEGNNQAATATLPPSSPIRPRRLTLLVDTFAVLMYFVSSDVASGRLPSLFFLLPDYSYYRRLISRLERVFRAVDIELVWYLDTAGVGNVKANEHVRRNQQKIQTLSVYSDYLCGFTSKRPPPTHNLHPCIMTASLIAAFRALGSDFKICVGEADLPLARDAIRHGVGATPEPAPHGKDGSRASAAALPHWHGCVWGVLSRDADFAITAGIRYFNIENICVSQLDSTVHLKPAAAQDETAEVNILAAAAAPSLLDDRAERKEEKDSDDALPLVTVLDAVSARLTKDSTDGAPDSASAALPSMRLSGFPFSVSVVSQLLSLPAHRLTELSFLCGNDYSKGIARSLAKRSAWLWRYEEDGSLRLPAGETIQKVLRAFSEESVSAEQRAPDVPYDMHERLECWITYLQHVESSFGPERCLESIQPFSMLREDEGAADVCDLLEHCRAAYEWIGESDEEEEEEEEEEDEEDETPPESPPIALASADPSSPLADASIFAFLRHSLELYLVPTGIFGWLSNGTSHGQVWWENIETLSSANIGASQAFRAAGTSGTLLLPSVDSIIRPLVMASASLFNMRRMRIYERRDAELDCIDSDFSLLMRYQQSLSEAIKPTSNGALSHQRRLRVQIVQQLSTAVKFDVLDALFNDAVWFERGADAAAECPLQWLPHLQSSASAASTASSCASTTPRHAMLVLLCRWTLARAGTIVTSAPTQSQDIALPNSAQLLRWCSVLVQCTLLLDCLAQRNGADAGVTTPRFTVTVRKSQLAESSSSDGSSSSVFPVAPPTSSSLPSIESVSMFSTFTAVYLHLAPLLTSMQLHDDVRVMAPEEMFPW